MDILTFVLGLFILFHPHGTPPIPGGIAAMEKVRIGGVDQRIMIRGQDPGAPILLFLHGGPGVPQMQYARHFESGLEKRFIVVNWDQRGSGLSYDSNIPSDSMNMEQFISDTGELSRYLLKRFNKPKLYLVGHSWGSILGVLAAQRYPELYYSYVGIGQSTRSTEEERAYALGNPVPAPSLRVSLGILGTVAMTGVSILEGYENNASDLLRFAAGRWFTKSSAVYKESDACELRDRVRELKIPVLFCLGRYDNITPPGLAKEYLDMLDAPEKKFVWFDGSGHDPFVTEPGKFAETMESMLDGK